MTSNIRLAIIIAAGLIIAALFHGGIYEMTGTGFDSFAYRLNKFTGSVQVCVGFECEPVTVRPGGIGLKQDGDMTR